MARRPRILSESPSPLDVEDPRGDVLADVIGASLVRNSIYRRLECRAPWGMAIGKKGRATFYIVARGSLRIEVGKARAELSAGDVALVPHGPAHTLRDAPDSPLVHVCDGRETRTDSPVKPSVLGGKGAATSLVVGFFEFRGTPRPSLLASLPELVVVAATDARAQPWMSAIVQLLVAESASPGPATALVQQRLADVLLVHALRALMQPQHCPTHGIRALSDPKVAEALGMMHARVEHDWTLVELAQKVGLSRSAFAARFSELVGEPPLQYLARWRMARAAELLEDPALGIDEIATRVGYESVPSFSKAFKRWQGQSPGAYRKVGAATL